VRRALLAAHAERLSATHLATAHHADDQAETVLMRLAAGSGIGGLAGMRDNADRLGLAHIRPLLGFRKAELVAFCGSRKLPAAVDPGHSDARFARARLRAAASALAAEGLTTERLTRLAARAARADEALAAATAEAVARSGMYIAKGRLSLDWRIVGETPAEIRLRVLSAALRRTPGLESPIMLEGLERLLDAIDAAHASGRRLRRSLAGRIVSLAADGALKIEVAPPRRALKKTHARIG
jgi:tRNA(Ile)-lysidine synthase